MMRILRENDNHEQNEMVNIDDEEDIINAFQNRLKDNTNYV